MKKQSFIYGMLMATSFLACENELPFRDKPQEPQLLMNAFLEAGKEKNEVFLHIVDGNGTTSFLEGAIIVYVNDEKTEEARFTSAQGDYKTAGSFAASLYDNYIVPAQKAGCQVILCTPIVRRTATGIWEDSNLHITSDSGKFEGGN